MKVKHLLRTTLIAATMLLWSGVGWGQGNESFNNSTATATYLDGSFVGDNGFAWTYGHSRNEDTFPIDGNGLMLRRASDSYLEATIPGGVGSFSFEYRKAYTGTSVRQLELIINGVQVATTPEFGPTEPDPNVYTFSVDNINTAGDVTVKIKNIGTTTTNRQTVIDNISWTGFTSGAPIPPSITNITQDPTGIPNAVTTLDAVSISADVTAGDAAISSGELRWGTTAGDYINTITMTVGVGDTYVGDLAIPAQADGTNVYYVIYAEDVGVGEDKLSSTSAEQSYTVVGPKSTTFPYLETFDTDLSDCYTYSVLGDQLWSWNSGGSANMSGYSGTNLANEDWLITPALDFTGLTKIALVFDEMINFSHAESSQEVLVSTDYSGVGNPNDATWVPLTITNRAGGSSWDFVTVDNIDLSAYAAESNVHIGFKYTSTTNGAATWRVDNINVYDSSLPVLNVDTEVLSGFKYIFGYGPSTSQTVAIDGENFDPAEGNIAVNATGTSFEVSTDDITYSATVDVPYTAGELSSTPVYIRLKSGLAAGDYSNEIINISGGTAPAKEITASGSVSPLPPGLPYAEDFSNFVFANDTEFLVYGNDEEWSFDATGSSSDKYKYKGDWGSGTAGGFRGNANVLGYQHTGTTGVLTTILTLFNNTGAVLEELFISYIGMVERVTETRPPEWTVKVNGVETPELAYSTDVDADQKRSVFLQGLSIANNTTFTIEWSSERGGTAGSSRQVGIGNVVVKTDIESATINPIAGQFDINDPQDVATTVTWNDAATVASITLGATPLTLGDDYTVVDNTLTILASYFNGTSLGDKVFTIAFDQGNNATFTVGVVEITPTYEVTFSYTGEGALTAKVDDIAITSGDLVEEGKNVVFTATPDFGHRVKDWLVDDVSVGETTESYTVNSLAAAVDVKVEFEPIPTFPITFNVDMSAAGTFTKAYIAGDANFDGYYTGLQELTESGAWYTVTLNLPDGTYEYKYYTNDIDGAEVIAASRSVTVAGEAKTINELWSNANAGAAISPATRDYDLTNPANVTTTITWYAASAIEKINDGTADLTVTDHYTLVGNTLTIKNEYLATKLTAEGQSVPLEITFDAGEAITFTVNAIESAIINADITPVAAVFDKHNPTDLATEITWNDAKVINKIELDAAELVLDTDYTLVGTTLTLKEAYLAGLDPAEGAELVFTITFDVGNAATYTVTVLESAAITPVTATYDILNAQDIEVEITWNDAASIGQITYGAVVLATPADYTLEGNMLIIQQAFFEGLTIAQGDEVNLDIAFNAGADAALAVNIIKSATLDTEAFEFYENWPNDPVEITITWNSASTVDEFQFLDTDTDLWTMLPPVVNDEKFWEVIDIDGTTATLKIYLANAPAKSAGAKEGDQYTGFTELTRVVFDVGQPAEMDIVMKVKVFNLTFVVKDTEGAVISGAETTLELINEEGGFEMSDVNSFIVEAGAAYKYTVTAQGYIAETQSTVAITEDTEIPVVLEEEIITTFPFATNFENADAWAGGTWTGYNEKTYIDEGWHFHTTNAVRGDASESFGESSFSFRDRGIFTIKNLAPIEGMKGFSFQLRDWMYSTDIPDGADRDIQVSFDGGTTWEVVATINKTWFDEYQVYQEFLHTFSELKNFDAEKLVIQIEGGTGANDSRINIGQFKAFDIIAPTITPESAEFDLYVPADIDITIKWGDATQLTSVKVDGADLATEFYTLDGNTLTIKQAFFANAEYLDVYMFDLIFDTEHKLTATVSVIDTEFNHASIDPLTAKFDVFVPADVTTTITWNDATELVSVSVDGTALTKDVDFELVENDLTILEEYFANVNAGDEITFTLGFDVGGNLRFKVTVIDTTPIDIETLAELRTKAADGTAYRYTGEAVIVAMDGNRNRKFLQDETAAIMIDDNNGIITTEYQLYDVITNVTGRISIFNSMVQFVPSENTAAATQNTPVEPVEFALANVASADQAKLVVLKGVSFKALTEGQLFVNSKNYTITDGANDLVVRTDFRDIDLIGDPIPQSTADVAGVVLQYGSTLQIIPRFANDFYAYSTDATLAEFKLGDQDALVLDNVLVDKADDEGAFLYKEDLTGFSGIVVSATDDKATVMVTLNGTEVTDLAGQALASGDVVLVTVTAEDGVTENYFKVTITDQLNTEADILTFSFAEQNGDAVFGDGTIDIEVKYNADITDLVANFTLSRGAAAKIGDVSQENGVTANDFTTPITYKVTAEDGVTTKDWVVTVTVQPIPQYSVTFSAEGGNGNITAAVGDVSLVSGNEINAGSRVVFTADPAPNYKVKVWTLNGTPVENNTTNEFVIESLEANAVVTVEFEQAYTVTFSVVEVGGESNGTLAATVNTVAITSGDIVKAGSAVAFTATPDANYRVKAWSLNGNTITDLTENTYTITDLTANVTVTVEFEVITSVPTISLNNIKAYPNPFTNAIKLENVEMVTRVIVTDMIGKQVMMINLNGENTINTSSLREGVYLIILEGENGQRVVRRMIKR